MDKKELAEQILATGGSLFVLFDATKSIVPLKFRNERTLKFQYGHNLPYPIPDLFINADGISASLVFSGAEFSTFVPWSAVQAIHDDKFHGQAWLGDLFAKVGQASLADVGKPKKPALRLIRGGKR